ncbi:DEAD/DEAH box helicase [Bacillus dakarensis]|uniref:DEAD/DEAH box helicase n=1 Tax=Robertmurraya dakarensis TaxID=1926278 RepID=UPI000980C94F|nr:DEAD/DEAH box helicase [Bacillus dakarensis]
MKFAIINERLVPEPLLHQQEPTYPISNIETIPQPPINKDYSFNHDLQNLLTGKQLPLDELPYSIHEIHQHYENGCLIYRKGITFQKGKAKCERCGNTDQNWFAAYPCSRCGTSCTYCRRCLMMGRVSACTPLCSWSVVNSFSTNNSQLAWTGTLSQGQQTASTRVCESVANDSVLLVWAVCGAGKTEVLFEGIERALQQQKRVCIATPRTDVVLELTPRLQAVFPHIQVASLYGGSEDRHKQSPLTIATIHQLLRFYKAFDTIILDEVDAFPYSVDETLQYAVKNARKDQSSMIYLTATPNPKWRKECRLGKRNFVTIPARFHRHPLPVPEFVWCGRWQKPLKNGKLPQILMKWLHQRLQSQTQALLFIPKIDLIPVILPILHKLHPKIEAVHAEDPQRKEKVQRMRNKEIPILITTTILERGVTFPNLDVAVLGAEDRIFTESALVQIAGRVGRSKQYPTGNITFFHFGRTEAMTSARKQILSMNKEAVEKGLVDV